MCESTGGGLSTLGMGKQAKMLANTWGPVREFWTCCCNILTLWSLRLCWQRHIIGAFGFRFDSLRHGLVALDGIFAWMFAIAALVYFASAPHLCRTTFGDHLVPLSLERKLLSWVGENGTCPLVGNLGAPWFQMAPKRTWPIFLISSLLCK